MFRTRQSTLDGHLPFLDAQWSGGCRNGAELWRRLKGQASRDRCAWWRNGRRDGGRAETISHQQLQKVPAARTIAQLMATKRDHLTKAGIARLPSSNKTFLCWLMLRESCPSARGSR